MGDQLRQPNRSTEVDNTLDKDFVDGIKLHFDTEKHLTTLSTGSILVLIALLEKVFASPHWKPLIVVSFLGFTLSIVFSVRYMRYLGMFLMKWPKVSDRESRRGQSLGILGSYSFLAAIISFIVFAIRNFW